LDNDDIDGKIDVTAKLFLLIQNRQQTHGWTLIRSGANGLGIQECGIYIFDVKVLTDTGKQKPLLQVADVLIFLIFVTETISRSDRNIFSINVELASTFFTLQRFGLSLSPNFKCSKALHTIVEYIGGTQLCLLTKLSL